MVNVALEGLVAFAKDGRPQAWLAESWSTSPDGLQLTIRLRPHVTFHDGRPVTAALVRQILIDRLPSQMGRAFSDLERIDVVSDEELVIVLRNRSAFMLEALDVLIQMPGKWPIGTGPFYPHAEVDGGVQMLANPHYFGGPPALAEILIKPYVTVRSAWADMLRGELDMLYEVGVDAMDLLGDSSDSDVYTSQRPYAFVLILNTRRPNLQDAGARRALNAAINRPALILEALNNHGRPAHGPVWPEHWAYSPSLSQINYDPDPDRVPSRLSILFTEPSHERLALSVQRQLSEVGIDVKLETAPLDKAMARVEQGDFEVFLADAISGPSLVRPYLFWHSQSPLNWGGFKSPRVDAALDSVRHAADDEEYRAGVAEFQRAIADDPPAIFLAWSQRARAVSTRFEVPVEEGRDILSTLRLWRPAGPPQRAQRN